MANCQKLDDETFVISDFSNTEVNRHFIKISPKKTFEEFQDAKNYGKLKIRIGKKSFNCVWGTQNRLYINKRNFTFGNDSEIKLRFLKPNEVEFIE